MRYSPVLSNLTELMKLVWVLVDLRNLKGGPS